MCFFQRSIAMLRPAKLFQPIYQLRQYVQHKIAELVVQQSILTTSIQQITTTTTTVGNNVLPIITHQPPKPLTQHLQKQFPMINKACSPFLRIAPTTTTITSNFGTTSSLHYLRHHSQPAIGTYRAYSSSSTCFMKHMYISPSSNPSIFSHLSSNGAFMKTPLGQQWHQLNHHQYQQQKNKYEESPIVPYKQQKEEETKHKKTFKKWDQPIINKTNHSFISQPMMKNEKKKDIIEKPIELKKEKENNTIKEKNSFCLQKEDDMMTIHSTNISTSVNYYYIHVDLLPPPNTTNSLFMSMISSKSSSMNKNHKKEKDWLPLSQDLMSFFISWKEKQQTYYQHFIQWIQFFVDKQFHFSITNEGQSLRLYFPKHVIHKEQALSWLNDINEKFYHHLQQQYYKKRNHSLNHDDNEVVFPHWSLHQETRLVQEPLLPLGPDYFQGLQLFLDEIDDLFHHGPAFSKNLS
ncbi:unnamed protein product [Cunninghamella blakesleeana]